MLKTARHAGQSIRIGADITVTIINVNDSLVHIGIDAPAGVDVRWDASPQPIQVINGRGVDAT